MEFPNFTYINDLAGNDEAFRARLVNVIKAELPGEIAEYKKSLQNTHYSEAANHVHKLKHKISVMGMEKSYYIAEKFEDNLKNGRTDLKVEFENILNAMEEFAAAI